MRINENRPVLWWILFYVTVFLFLYLQSEDKQLLSEICVEDGILEYSTAAMYFVASVIFAVLWKKAEFKNIWHLGLFVMFFMVAGEEVSWGQRIFNIATPDALVELNVQQEMNLHNIEGVHGIVRAVGLLIVLAICYVLPLTDKFIHFFRKLYCKMKMPIFPVRLLILPTVAILFMAVPRIFFDKSIFNLDEIGEMYLGLTFLMFSLNSCGFLCKKSGKETHPGFNQ